MKIKKLFSLAIVGLSTTATARETADTLVIEQPHRVEIINAEGSQTVNVLGSKQDPYSTYTTQIATNTENLISRSGIKDNSWEFELGPIAFQHGNPNKNRKPKRSAAMKFAFGWNSAPEAPSQMEVRPFKSWELWWIVCEQRFRPWRDHNVFSVGLGLNWRNYRMNQSVRFEKQGEQILLSNLPQGATLSYSRLKVFSVNFPIRYQFRKGGCGFSVGPVVNFNFHSSLRTEYTLDGGKRKEKAHDAYVTPVTVDLMATIRAARIEAYVKYSPMDVLQSKHGPKFQSLSFGFLL